MKSVVLNPETMQVGELDGKKVLLTRSDIGLQFLSYALQNISNLSCIREDLKLSRLFSSLCDYVESLVLPFKGDIIEEYFVIVQKME